MATISSAKKSTPKGLRSTLILPALSNLQQEWTQLTMRSWTGLRIQSSSLTRSLNLSLIMRLILKLSSKSPNSVLKTMLRMLLSSLSRIFTQSTSICSPITYWMASTQTAKQSSGSAITLKWYLIIMVVNNSVLYINFRNKKRLRQMIILGKYWDYKVLKGSLRHLISVSHSSFYF